MVVLILVVTNQNDMFYTLGQSRHNMRFQNFSRFLHEQNIRAGSLNLVPTRGSA